MTFRRFLPSLCRARLLRNVFVYAFCSLQWKSTQRSRAVRVGHDTLNWRDLRLPGLDLILAFLTDASSNFRVMLPAADVGLR